MKKILIIVVITFLTVSFYSCDILLDILGLADSGTGNFWATNFNNDRDYKVDAELLYIGEHCEVWVEKGKGVDAGRAKEVGKHFDEHIYSKMINAFSMTNFSIVDNGKTYNFTDIMDFANWLAATEEDRSGKLCILLLDIKDNYGPSNGSYVAGYFWAGNFLNGKNSNHRDMIYIDVNPGLDGDKIEDTFGTLAHEMQHLMNFATTIVLMVEEKKEDLTDTWVDEGLASAAEWVYSGKYEKARISWFNNNGFELPTSDSRYKNTRGLIDKGNTFFIWNNRDNENQYAVMDDYSTVNIFFQWLRLQSNNNIYRDIITSEYSDYQAVTNAFNKYASMSYTWDTLLSSWFAANHINAQSGLYGYKNEEFLNTIKFPGSSAISTSISLAPGEGVYSKTSTNPNFSSSTNIKYAYLSSSTLSTAYSSGSTLLTYNANTDKGALSENGSTTGSPIPVSASITASQGRSALSETIKPYRIDAGEILRNKPIDTEQLTGLRRAGKTENE